MSGNSESGRTKGAKEKGMINKWSHLVGKKFGRWTARWITEDVSNHWAGVLIRCECDCGTFRDINRRYLVRGQTKSCGCLVRDKNAMKRIAR